MDKTPRAFLVVAATMLLLSWGFGSPAAAQPKSLKRGLAYGYHSVPDLQALAPGLSWWYNWSAVPDAGTAAAYPGLGFDYVPMQWNGRLHNAPVTAVALAAQVPAGARYLLGFNEPNFRDQANLTPAQAAALWPVLEDVARQKNLQLVAPAVNYCGNCVTDNGVTYNSPVKYLDAFFAACPTCRVDYLAVHTYVCEERYLREKIAELKKYNRTIWLTEFACGDFSPGSAITLPMQQKYLMDAVNYLEHESAVFRYAWFSGRNTEIPFINLLAPAAGQLTALGQEYVGLPYSLAGLLAPVAATASSQEKAATGAGNAIDGDINTRWASVLGAGPQYVQLDFGSVQSFSRIQLSWEAAYASDYQLQTSPDGQAWTPLLTVANGDGGVDNLTGLSGQGRFLRLTATQRGTPYGYSLWEIEAFGAGAPLPVALTSFVAGPQGPAVALRWATASEQGNKGFAVQRSADGGQFADLAFVPGAGDSATPRQYAYLDAHPLRSAPIYYRLRQLDAAGQATFSPVVAVSPAAGPPTVYPNPATARATAEWDAPAAGPGRWLLANATGQVVHAEYLAEQAGRNFLPLDLSAYPAGSYVLTLESSGCPPRRLRLLRAD